MIDWHDSEKLNLLADKNIELAMTAAEARREFSGAKYALDMILAKAYFDKEIDPKVAYEKAVLLLISGEKKEEVEKYYKALVLSKAQFEGLDRVIEANKDKLVLSMSLSKNRIAETRS